MKYTKSAFQNLYPIGSRSFFCSFQYRLKRLRRNDISFILSKYSVRHPPQNPSVRSRPVHRPSRCHVYSELLDTLSTCEVFGSHPERPFIFPHLPLCYFSPCLQRIQWPLSFFLCKGFPRFF